MRVVTKLFLSGVIAVAGVGVFGGVASAQQGYANCSISVSQVSGPTLRVTGTAFPDGPVDILFDGVLVAETVAASDISVEFNVPANTSDGVHTITAVPESTPDETCEARIRIESGVATPDRPRGLAFTGSDNTNLALIGAGAVALGGVLVVAIRRRTRSSISAG